MAKRLMVLLGMLALLLTTALPAAFAQEEEQQYAGGEVSATGVIIGELPADVAANGTHSISDEATGTTYALRSAGVDLDSHVGERVTVYGTLTPGQGPAPGEEFGGSLPSIDVTSVVPAEEPDEGSEVVILGTVTDISGSVVLVEEDSSAQSGDKGYFTVTDETEIGRLVGGDALAPAAFEELEVGQTVEAVYAGAVAESYPTQGNAASITILEETGPPPGRSATLSFELAVECEPPAGATFFGNVRLGEGGPGIFAELLDPDGDGLYTGVATLPDRFAPGPAPEGTPPVSLPVQIVQGTGTRSAGAGTLPGEPTSVVEDFGVVAMEPENTFSADASFCDGGNGNGNGGNGGDGNGGGAGGTDGDGGTIPSGITQLPATGGVLPVAGAVGAALVAAGLIARRITR